MYQNVNLNRTTVDGRNPAPVDLENIPLFNIIYIQGVFFIDHLEIPDPGAHDELVENGRHLHAKDPLVTLDP